MKNIFVPIIITSVLSIFAGCNNNTDIPNQPDNDLSAVSVEPAAQIMPAVKQPDNTPLVEVNGKTITRQEIIDQVENRITAIAQQNQLSPQQIEHMRMRMMDQTTKQMIDRLLLIEEADRNGITVTEDDEKSALAKIQESLPENVSVEELMERSPMGAEKMRQEIIVGIKIEKLLAPFITNEVEVTESEINDYYANNLRHARHILIAREEDDSEETIAGKRQKAESLRTQLTDGADFAELAAKESSCPSGKRSGGDLSVFGRNQMVKAFEDAAFSQEPNVIGPVIETQFGFHIIEVLPIDRTDGEYSEENVAENIRHEKRMKEIGSFLETLRAKATIKAHS